MIKFISFLILFTAASALDAQDLSKIEIVREFQDRAQSLRGIMSGAGTLAGHIGTQLDNYSIMRQSDEEIKRVARELEGLLQQNPSECHVVELLVAKHASQLGLSEVQGYFKGLERDVVATIAQLVVADKTGKKIEILTTDRKPFPQGYVVDSSKSQLVCVRKVNNQIETWILPTSEVADKVKLQVEAIIRDHENKSKEDRKRELLAQQARQRITEDALRILRETQDRTRKIQEDAQRRASAAAEAAARAAVEAQKKAAELAKKQAEETAKRLAEEEAKRQATEAARRAEEARKRAEEAARNRPPPPPPPLRLPPRR